MDGLKDARALQHALLDWYAVHGRELAFRRASDPWAVLVSEVMLQQTQVSRVEPAWERFLRRFPTPADLAAAPLAEAVRAWAGLGYNRRAVSLHRAARVILERWDGRVPSSVVDLEALPGVGPYTARAVAALCFGAPVAALDVNIGRVIGRVATGWGRDGDPGTRLPAAELQRTGDAMVDPTQPAAWTHAAMDLGAIVCRPRDPDCDVCPLRSWCGYAHAQAPRSPSLARASSTRAREPFPASSRWLRGRIVQRLALAQGDSWVRVVGPIGNHGAPAVAAALVALERDGLVERADDGSVRLPVSGT